MSDSVWYTPSSSTWGTNAATTWSSGTTYTITYPTNPGKARVVLEDVPVQTPTPRTEVERLLAEVEAICALAR